jgi:hypothetical protein
MKSAHLVLTLGLLSAAIAATVGAQQWSTPPPSNLQVLPKDIQIRPLVETMRGFTSALGARCQHCHVYKGENPDDLQSFDFASDEKPAKLTARTMLGMVQTINGDTLKHVGEPRPDDESKVTCWTCHRGERRPQTRRPPV